ncbi:hypothetical protein D7V80_18810 [Corallococcus sp. CA054B]|nr:hypothetical protein D7V80_18810 [Corallococcus sp. CA054B]
MLGASRVLRGSRIGTPGRRRSPSRSASDMPSIPWLRTSGLAVAVLCLSACDSDPDTTKLHLASYR